MKLQFTQQESSETTKVVLGLDFFGWIFSPACPPLQIFFEGNTGHYVPMQSDHMVVVSKFIPINNWSLGTFIPVLPGTFVVVHSS